MNYKQINIPVTNQDIRDILIAQLAELDYEGFEEGEDSLVAFIPEEQFIAAEIESVLEPLSLTYTTTLIPKQNWNEVWESNFQPVVVEGFCTIKASFHTVDVETPYEIVINPKMSFGTGHHATTQLMMRHMQGLDFKGKEVLDFGAGTGILSILAAKLGAANVVAVDHEEWAAENANDNKVLNNTTEQVQVILGSLEDVPQVYYDIILANINRHILLQYMEGMKAMLKGGGTILMSGILTEDESIVREAAETVGFSYQHKLQQGNWIAILLKAV